MMLPLHIACATGVSFETLYRLLLLNYDSVHYCYYSHTPSVQASSCSIPPQIYTVPTGLLLLAADEQIHQDLKRININQQAGKDGH